MYKLLYHIKGLLKELNDESFITKKYREHTREKNYYISKTINLKLVK